MNAQVPVIWLLVIAAFAVVFVCHADHVGQGTPESDDDCIHEIVYEPFAGLTLVPAELGDGVPLVFVLDSGANHSAVNDPVLAELLGLEVREAGLARGMGAGAARVLISQRVPIRSAGREILRTPLAIHDIGARLAAVAGREIDGLLGWELFERYVVELDPIGRRIFLHPSETFDYNGPGVVVPLSVEDQRPVIEARVWVREGRAVPVKLLLDTGSSTYLTLISGSRRRLVPVEGGEWGQARVGVVGSTRPVAGRLTRFELGSITAESLDVAWTQAHSVPAARNIPKLNGILGNRLLGRFRVFIDYHGGRLILGEPYEQSDDVTGNPDSGS